MKENIASRTSLNQNGSLGSQKVPVRLFQRDPYLASEGGKDDLEDLVFHVDRQFVCFLRICPGRHLADNSIWLAIARILAVFDISKAKDVNGSIIEPKIKFVTGTTRFGQFFGAEWSNTD